jgi:Protein of unknown function (DUF4238)
MARHHVVPQMLLRRFADADERIAMVAREDPGRVVHTKVRTAAAEVGFYRIPAEDLEEHARDGHDPELAERALADLESAAGPVIEGVLGGTLAIGVEERYRLSQFAALQLARGWRFRDEIRMLMTWYARQQLQIAATPDRVREHLRAMGAPADERDVREFLDGVLNGSWTLNPPRSLIIQASLQYAIGLVHPQLFPRMLRLIRFDQPLLLTSDSAVGLWAPRSQAPRSAGVADADVIFMPLNRCCALAFTQAGREVVLDAEPSLADHINLTVADNASKWIYHHPDDHPLARIELLPPPVLAEEIDDVEHEPGGTVRVKGRLVWR